MPRVCCFATIDFQSRMVVMGRDEPFFLGRVEPWLIALRMLHNNIFNVSSIVPNKVVSLDIILCFSFLLANMRSYNQKVGTHELLKRHINNYIGPLRAYVYDHIPHS